MPDAAAVTAAVERLRLDLGMQNASGPDPVVVYAGDVLTVLSHLEALTRERDALKAGGSWGV